MCWTTTCNNINSRNGGGVGGGVFDFSRLAYQADDGTNLVANGTFASAASWQNTLADAGRAVELRRGQASWTDGAIDDRTRISASSASFVALPRGKWTVQATITPSEGASSGRYGPPYCGFAFYADRSGRASWNGRPAGQERDADAGRGRGGVESGN